MSTSSNHTKAFVQCCHGKHTVASSRTLLSDHVTSSEHLRLVSQFFCDKSDLCCKRPDCMENTWVMVKVRHKKGCGTTSVGTLSSSICGQSYFGTKRSKESLAWVWWCSQDRWRSWGAGREQYSSIGGVYDALPECPPSKPLPLPRSTTSPLPVVWKGAGIPH